MSELHNAASFANEQVPRFGLSAYRPHDMRRFGVSSCLGRSVLAYTFLRARGAPDETMRLLVENTHAKQHKPGKYWVGHALLLVDIGETGVIDSNRSESAYVRDLSTVLPLPSEGPQPMYGVDGEPYVVYPVNEGLIAYQETHPLLAGPIVTAEDYATTYSEMVYS